MSYAIDTDTCRADFFVPLNTGRSDESRVVDESLEGIRSHLLGAFSSASRVQSVFRLVASVVCNHTEVGWDGYSARPVSEDAGSHAARFVLSLPRGVPPPEISADPSGGVELEWYRSPRHVFTARVSGAGKIHYSGLFGAAKQSGAEHFTGNVPKAILSGITRVIR